ncbi:CHAT domain-containing protein [Parasphingorhabdus halotolerans]|uniref:CHAT domain-containing protein n=1 Tax=Parasphingorhabdus halotolerans TaxID=2725558 RepID=A0A6H2DQE1_9SPHN|nr:CHAT domain-containing tetratricopeptide repeat protein [Parasphingorhabdus halotolerans]QJB70610.1 CHAT domain-containing protein [Parasphingorhabdus halotolerans]
MIRRKNFTASIFNIASIVAPAITLMASSSIAYAQGTPVTLRDSFPIGKAGGILCQVQDRSLESAVKQSIYDRSWAVVCRDSARPVGYVYAAKTSTTDLLARVAPQRKDAISCPDNGTSAALNGFSQKTCRLSDEPVSYSVIEGTEGGFSYVAEGLSVYDSATILALKSVLADSIVEGTIDIATTSVEDPFAFARVQAATLKPEQALAEGYRRNLSGDYAEAAAFFETLQQRTQGDDDNKIDPDEYLVNRALQKSNLGEFAEADRLFEQAKAVNSGNTINERLLRNFEGMHLLNQGRYDEAIVRIQQPLRTGQLKKSALIEGLEITTPISSRINGRNGVLLGFTDDLKLTEQERAEIIDAQALQLIGTAQRINGDLDQAKTALFNAYHRAIAVRDGRVVSITRLRVQTLSELALIAEAQGQFDDGEALLRNGLELLSIQYPETRAVNGAKAKLASFLLRRGKTSEARQLYQQVIESSLGQRSAVTGMTNQLAPYFRLMADDPSASEEFFKASQILIRPGVAETQAVLSRELSAGNDEASRLFRQSLNLTRNIERLRIRFSALGKVEQTGATIRQRNDLASQIDELERSQQLAQVQLADYPQYRAVSSKFISLEDLRAQMTPSEAYMRLAIVGRNIFMFYADKESAKIYQIELNEDELDQKVDLLRASISTFENGRYVTYPYDIEAARDLYKSLFAPVSDRLLTKQHLVFEPDGALLRLPINLLVTDDASVTQYIERTDQPDGDAFDYTGVNWLGKSTDISTAVSARAFADAREAPVSSATRQYLGMGRNLPVSEQAPSTGVRASSEGQNANCEWSANEWNNPISDAELNFARSVIGQDGSEILTGGQFTDSQIMQKSDISDYRILHFATHGLVTAPRPSCPAKPALLTSFGQGKSDGLLSFDEIFDLKLDADIVILSACDTAGKASIQATREAGVSSGGGTALDGLVRSFIGAGSRSVLASHWPAPDDFKATERLIGGLFSDGKGESVGSALRNSQNKLMDDPQTSHPYYWSGFAIIGDGARPFLPDQPTNGVAKVMASGSSETQLK